MLSLVVAALFFAGIHLGVAGTPLRDALVGRLGSAGYSAVFSVASVIGILWLVYAFDHAPYVATWGAPVWWRPAAIVLMLPALLLAVIGLATPNPTAVAQERRLAEEPRGILRVTRHPFLIGVALWSLVHVVANGDVAALLFFGCFGLVALIGTRSIDEKRRRLLGAGAWQPFAARTSILPFAAIAAGRNRFQPGEIGLWRWALGILAYALVLGGHAHVFGVSPFPP
jgi:uncharacterized membrane protein